jgi:hypothetical protein
MKIRFIEAKRSGSSSIIWRKNAMVTAGASTTYIFAKLDCPAQTKSGARLSGWVRNSLAAR